MTDLLITADGDHYQPENPQPTGRRGAVLGQFGEYKLVLHPDGEVTAGCQVISKRELLALWRKIGKHLGYAIKG